MDQCFFDGVIIRSRVFAEARSATPTESARIWRKAFLDSINKDAEFFADTQRAQLDLDPIDDEETQKPVRELFKLEPALVAKMKEILQ